MALVPDQKFSTFDNGGDLEVGDIVVGLRNGLNTRFSYTGELPVGVVVPISQGGTGATTAAQARINLGLGTMAVQNATAVAITGGTISGVAISSAVITASTAALTAGSVVAAPVAGTDLVNKTYVDSLVVGTVTSVSGTLNRITSTGGTTPVIDISASYVGQTSITTLGTIGTGVWQGTTVAIGFGGTGVTSVTTSPTATAFAGWDANLNLSANNFLPRFTSTVSAAGTTVLTVASTYNQEITGSTTQTFTLPVTSTLTAGHSFFFINNSSGNVTINSSGGNAVLVMAANTTASVTCVLNSGTTAASWNASYVFDAGAGVISITGTANQVIASASTGNVTLSLPQSIATTSSPTFAALTLTAPLTVPNGGTGLSSATAYAVVCGGTTSTSALQSIASVGTAGQVLTSNGAGALPTMQTVSSAGSLKSFQIFTSGTAQTYTRPAGIASILVECLAGGGGGGGVDAAANTVGAAGGGGGGGYGRKWYASAASTYTYTVGGGGNGGTAGANNGSTGTNTTFDTMTANGGVGGMGIVALNVGCLVAVGGVGGGSTGCDVNGAGYCGQSGVAGLGSAVGGAGGGSLYGGGAVGVFNNTLTTSTAGGTGGLYGGGGSGAVSFTGTVDRAGGNGAAGLIIVWEFS